MVNFIGGSRRVLWIGAAVGGLAVGLLGGAVVAYAQTGTGNINACINNTTRVVRIPTGACAANETPIAWNQRGPTGPAGAQGANGANGFNGANGQNGAQGPAGPAGSPGAAGPTGAQGAAGPAGAPGTQGVAGPQGPAGPAGSGGTTLEEVCSAGLSAPQAGQNVDIFLELAGIEGESLDDRHQGEIDVMAFVWDGICQTATNAGSGSGVARFAPMQIFKHTDKATPLLFKAAAQGTHIVDGRLTLRRGGLAPIDYLVIDFQDILITGGGDNLSFVFGKINLKYTPTKQDGTAGPSTTLSWDVKANKEG
jgi:type VI secretion system secreted protein Hcp